MTMKRGPVDIQGTRIVRLREIRTPMPPFMMVTWGVFDLHAGSRAKPLFKTLTRKDAAAIATREGWKYVGLQETVPESLVAASEALIIRKPKGQ